MRLWRLLCATSLIVFAVSHADADLTIAIGDAQGIVGTKNVLVPVTVSGGDFLSGVSFAFQVGDGGDVLAGNETITISEIDFVSGTIWGPVMDDTSFTFSKNPVDLTPPIRAATVTNTTITEQNTSVLGDGLLMTINLDLSAVTNDRANTFVPINPIVDLGFGKISTVQNAGVEIPTEFTGGTLEILPIPEPGAFLLCSCIVPFFVGLSIQRIRKNLRL